MESCRRFHLILPPPRHLATTMRPGSELETFTSINDVRLSAWSVCLIVCHASQFLTATCNYCKSAIFQPLFLANLAQTRHLQNSGIVRVLACTGVISPTL